MLCTACGVNAAIESDGLKLNWKHTTEPDTPHDVEVDDALTIVMEEAGKQVAALNLALTLGGCASLVLDLLIPLHQVLARIIAVCQASGDALWPAVKCELPPAVAKMIASSMAPMPDDISSLFGDS